MEMLVASAIGLMTATGLFLILQGRSFPVIVGLTFLSYAVNAFLFAMGRLTINLPPIITPDAAYTDPLPQALVLTAIVISFGMTALIVVLGLRGFLETGSDRTDLSLAEAAKEPAAAPDSDPAGTPAGEATRA
ncbi:multisubunit potassium/proton antiporter PhaC subunit [Ancylobacter aquaticus]|uniref:Multisubunit potassium/proton antiporter PhaC subunit n=1 Tax=Ancylobacter aquaticus TaxID=100 RepID=A0A4R1I1Q7_ANCAQ|nr:Na+/H+ antiporter subunit C [Ancylobacter aquaticus]TCK29127.1 multisubunit potassium/proton antiporter PhaC subunit [Ancylobacter aquaticus]